MPEEESPDPGAGAEAPPGGAGSSEHDPPVPDPPNPEIPAPVACCPCKPRRPRQPRKPRVPKTLSTPGNPAPEPPPSLENLIREAMAGPKSVAVDGQNVTAHDLRQLLDADRYLAAKKAAGKPAIRFSKLVPPGAE